VDGKPLAKLVPADRDTDVIYNFLASQGTVTGDIIAPAVADRGHLR
jgi:hypothetical protein